MFASEWGRVELLPILLQSRNLAEIGQLAYVQLRRDGKQIEGKTWYKHQHCHFIVIYRSSGNLK